MIFIQDPRNLLIIFKSSLLVIHYLPIGECLSPLVVSCHGNQYIMMVNMM